MQSFDPEIAGTRKIHQLMLGAIAPRPIAFASTIDPDGNPNLSPFSFFNAFGVNPTTLIFSPSRRGRNNTTKHTYQNVKLIPEVVINVVTWDILEQANLASSEYPYGVNEFTKAGFTMLASEKIRPFRVAESAVQFECKVRQVIETGEGGGSANLVICEILLMHVNEDVLDENGNIDPDKIRLVGRMGGSYYVKAFGSNLFRLSKPAETPGIGIDQLPANIRSSTILSGNDLGKLGHVLMLPEEEEVEAVRTDREFEAILRNFPNDPARTETEVHLLAKELLEKGKLHEALCLLMAY